MSYLEWYKGTSAYNEATAMPVILENGRKVFGPPQKYSGPRPSHLCELYVTHIPLHLDELDFLVWLHRIGQVYAFRLMMDTGNTTRGYGFVRFCTEKDALAAFELLKFLYVDGERLSVFRSQGKNRLFVSGIPRQLPLSCLEDGFKLCFPHMQSCTAYPAIKGNLFSNCENEENRGYAFIEFEDHDMALAAKKRLNTGRVRMWGTDLKIQWAKPKEEMQVTVASKKFQEANISSSAFSHLRNNSDYCTKFRLYCLANNLCIPVILYGPCFRNENQLYAGVLMKNAFTGFYCYFILEISLDKINDVHLLICEIALKMVEECRGKLSDNAIIRVISDNKAEIVYNFKDYNELMVLELKNRIRFPKIIELAVALQLLGQQNHEKLLLLYKRAFLTHLQLATFCLDTKNPFAQFCAILPKFRNNAKLNNNFNDLEITLLLMAPSDRQQSREELIDLIHNRKIEDQIINTDTQMEQKKLQHYRVKKSQYMTLKSQNSTVGIKYTLRYVDVAAVELRECYHPEQRVNSNPVWIAGHSYQQSIYK